MSSRNIVVLMATYNGARYIRTQIESILAQTGCELRLVIRDDCSTDDTGKLIREYAESDARVTVMDNAGIRKGAIGNFLELIKHAPEADYYALADQDDYWCPDKLSTALDKLGELDGGARPMLYCSAKEIVDSELKSKYISKSDNPRLVWGNGLVENLCTGCTAVFNKGLRAKLLEGYPKHTVMHDWWIYMIALAFGEVYYDENSYIKYRQHGNNEYGEITTFTGLWRYRLGQLFARRGQIYEQIEEFLSIYASSMKTQDVDLSRRVLDSRHNMLLRLSLVWSGEVFRQAKSDNRVARFLILAGKL